MSGERKNACQKVMQAIQKYPYILTGRKRYCSELMEAAGEEVIGKTGADGIYSLAFPGKEYGAPIKIDDGKMGPQYNVAQKLIKYLKILKSGNLELLDSYLEKPLKN